MISKHQLDLAVATNMGMHPKNVISVTDGFVEEIVRALATDGEVRITGLGTLRVKNYRSKVKHLFGDNITEPGISVRVNFTKSPNLMRILKEVNHGEERTRNDEVRSGREDAITAGT